MSNVMCHATALTIWQALTAHARSACAAPETSDCEVTTLLTGVELVLSNTARLMLSCNMCDALYLCKRGSIPVCKVPECGGCCFPQRRPAACQRQQQQRQVLGGWHCPGRKQDELLCKQHLLQL